MLATQNLFIKAPRFRAKPWIKVLYIFKFLGSVVISINLLSHFLDMYFIFVYRVWCELNLSRF
jgi:hypothetical protein